MAKVINLKGGAKLLYQKHKVSKATAFEVGIFRGSHLDENCGTSHLFEHMLFKGNKSLNYEQLTEAIKANFNIINAATFGGITLVEAYESSRKLDKVFQIASDMLINSTFEKAELEKEKQVVRQEIIRDNDDVLWQTLFNLEKNIYNYPEFKSKTLGDEKKMMAITQKDLINYRDNNVILENFFASVCSNKSARTIKKYINKHFINKLKSGNKNTFNANDLTINGDSFLKVDIVPRNKVVLFVACPLAFGRSDEKKCYYLKMLLKYINGPAGLLIEHFREKRQVVYTLSFARSLNTNDGFLYFQIETSKDKLNECFFAIRDFMQELRQGVSESVVARIKEAEIENKDAKIPNPYMYASDNLVEYYNTGKLEKAKVQKRCLKEISRAAFDDVIKCFTFEKIFVYAAGAIEKKDVMSLKEITKLLKS